MRYKHLASAVVAFAATCVFAVSAADSARWAGVWHGELDGQPGVILTLADDAGELGGTVVFNVVIKKDGEAHVAGSSVHLVKHPLLGPESLDFHVTRRSDGRDLAMHVQMMGPDRAQLQCQNCGQGNTVAELTRSK